MPLEIVPVFVSSTWLDLEPERRAVEAAVQRLRETKFVGMEHFGSRDETTRRSTLVEVDRSRIYVGIIAARYGSGITEAEYRRARELGLPCFIYFKEDSVIPADHRETGPAQAAKLDALKQELRANHTVGYFKSPDDLAARVTADLLRWLFDNYLTPKPSHNSPAPPSRLFISYRRGDSTIYARVLYERLVTHFGKDRVFMDVDKIEPGDDFIEVITNAVSSCSVLIALINKGWVDVKDEFGQRRLDNPDDFVHLEISTALKRDVRVIPVLVQGASMPSPAELPDALTGLGRRHAFEISDTRWTQDIERLIGSLEKYM